MTTLVAEARESRQRDLIPPARLARCHAVVIGVGAIGRQVALQLAALGIPSLSLYDPDTVAIENLAPQGFWESDLGQAKVTAVAELAVRHRSELEVAAVPERFRSSLMRGWPIDRDLIVFCCVDSIQTRSRIWSAIRPSASFFADGRMAAEVIRVLASGDPSRDTAYGKSLFTPEEAYSGRCTAKSTIYTANIAAGLMLSQWTRWLRGLPVTPDQTLNLLASELTVPDERVVGG